ncbi:SRPBCC family protein [Aquimarina sp. AU119]|uniref:SRPBCC family protein n=1 Tax=Aquimarina sp. AU119 TaxID=2108528 RepID=UPI000D698B8B|nr:SRPBCC family protein [Aquimarina sp. AU119]
MKYKGSVTIHQEREVVVALFMNEEYNKEYQDGFIKKELINGVPGQKGAKSKMYYKYGKQDMVITETITKNDLPQSLEAFYHHKHMDNTMKYTFTEVNSKTTQYDYECEYIRINWFLPKIIALFFPGIYRKQVEKWMSQFKEFAEKQ